MGDIQCISIPNNTSYGIYLTLCADAPYVGYLGVGLLSDLALAVAVNGHRQADTVAEVNFNRVFPAVVIDGDIIVLVGIVETDGAGGELLISVVKLAAAFILADVAYPCVVS